MSGAGRERGDLRRRDDATRVLTWAALLGKWTELARASVAFPRNAEGERWRRCVPDVIGLQAITHALGELDLLREDERGLALDRAAIGIKTHAASLIELFADENTEPACDEGLTGLEGIDELIAEAHEAWELAAGVAGAGEMNGDADDKAAPGDGGAVMSGGAVRGMIESEERGRAACGGEQARVQLGERDETLGFEWCVERERIVGEHPAELIERLLELGFEGDVYLPSPGSVLYRGEPAAFAAFAGGVTMDVVDAIEAFLEGVGEARRGCLRQVYRLTDFGTGRVLKDVVIDAGATPPGGQPQLVRAMKDGQACAVSLAPRRAAEVGDVPVKFA